MGVRFYLSTLERFDFSSAYISGLTVHNSQMTDCIMPDIIDEPVTISGLSIFRLDGTTLKSFGSGLQLLTSSADFKDQMKRIVQERLATLDGMPEKPLTGLVPDWPEMVTDQEFAPRFDSA